MSALSAVRAAAVAALEAAPGLAVSAVYDGVPQGATPPFAFVRELTASDWGTKDAAGRELRLGVTVRDASDAATRIEALAEAAEAALLALPRDLPGWRIASVVPVRCTILATRSDERAALIDVRVRVMGNRGDE